MAEYAIPNAIARLTTVIERIADSLDILVEDKKSIGDSNRREIKKLHEELSYFKNHEKDPE